MDNEEQNDKTLYIKIKSSELDTFWYKDKVGEIIEVTFEMIHDIPKYRLVKHPDRYVSISDADIVCPHQPEDIDVHSMEEI